MKTNGKITKELKELGTKINGKAPSGETISELINGIASDYEGGTGGTTVVANPTLAGTEDDLSGLQVGETKYKVPNVQLYEHNLNYFYMLNQAPDIIYSQASFKIINDNSQPLTYSDISAYVRQHFNQYQLLQASGFSYIDNFNKDYPFIAYGIFVDNVDNETLVLQSILATLENQGQTSVRTEGVAMSETMDMGGTIVNTISDIVIPLTNSTNNAQSN